MCANCDSIARLVDGLGPFPAKSIGSAADLASFALHDFVAAANVARLDTTIAATLMTMELLAALRIHAGVEPEDLVQQFRHVIDRRSAAMSAAEPPWPHGLTRGPDLADLQED